MDQDQNPTSGDGDNSPSDHEMYVKVEKPTPESRDRSSTPEDCAIEDSDEDDEEMVEIQRSMTQSRMMKQKSPEELRKKVIPFHWAPMLSPLTSADVDACETLERAALRGQRQISSKEQIEYRLRKCGSICVGLFNTYRPSDAKDWWIQTMRHARPVETGRQDGSKRVMFAHIIATLGKHPVVTDDDIQFPPNWRDPSVSRSSTLGHQTAGRTICLHSFSVCPEVQGIGIGKTAMKAYLQMMNESAVADRIALVCKESLIGFFARVGFKISGQSQTTVAGSGLHNMIFELPGPKAQFRLDMGSRRDDE
ncbi:GCN5-related N-acetyltransferase (GNAT) domain-containing protein [Pochonia chlamydosporia 170]|uniref:GCN5-related N-acetyltransferase (GNAT) domain-containing protein n=1 Tax=Pochonia chlamydosporia 170 TaxID=1380566 RepID=A0A179FCL1_METCM|nr:GCN5-related N-acetyltransferase (GNAT) domain-containing protein [Pochonia chlamydosporia 170]OAQ63234.1 GCN5-related N-acetyltransferase (GNAT) domain-containing protein [Pochonia chlamydosporia 170]